MGINAVLFDVDGVLIDAADWHFEAFNRALAPYGTPISRYEHAREYIGLTTDQKLARLVDYGRISAEDAPAIRASKHTHVSETIRARCQPDAGRIGLLKSLTGQGLRLAAVSNASRSTVSEMLDLAHLSQYLSVVVAGGDVARPKPNPDPYVHCALLLGVRPDECLAVEDGQYGVEAAMAAGMRVLHVAGPEDVTFEAISNVVAGSSK